MPTLRGARLPTMSINLLNSIIWVRSRRISPSLFGMVTWSSELSDRSGALPFGLHYVDLRVLAFHFDIFLQADLHYLSYIEGTAGGIQEDSHSW
jgi:hypothetical protein